MHRYLVHAAVGVLLLTLSPVGPRRSEAAEPVAPLRIDHDVTVDTMVSDRFTWRDAAGQPRAAVLAHNDGQTGPGGTRGGELREFRYETPEGTRAVRASGSGTRPPRPRPPTHATTSR